MYQGMVRKFFWQASGNKKMFTVLPDCAGDDKIP